MERRQSLPASSFRMALATNDGRSRSDLARASSSRALPPGTATSAGPATMYNLWDTVETHCALWGSLTAFDEGPNQSTAERRSVSYADLLARVKAICVGVSPMLTRGGIAMLHPNSHYHLYGLFAAAALHVPLQLLNHRLTKSELQSVLGQSHATIICTTAALLPLLHAIDWSQTTITRVLWTDSDDSSWRASAMKLPLTNIALKSLQTTSIASFQQVRRQWQTHQVDPVDVVVEMFFTSGTTGQPKSISHTHRNVLSHAMSTIRALEMNPETLSGGEQDCWGHFGPMFHVGTIAFVWVGLIVGARHVFHPDQSQYLEIMDMMSAERVSIVKLVPTVLKFLLSCTEERPEMSFDALKWILTGGQPLPAEVIGQTVARFGCDVIQGYGMTEATCHVAFKFETRGEDEAIGMKVIPGLELQILSNEKVPRDGAAVVGEVCIRGPTVFRGYDNVSNEHCFTAEGFFRSGDVGYLDKLGRLHIVGRLKDMIIVGGENVMAKEVERVIDEIEGIELSVAFPLEHDVLGEVVAAAVVASENGVDLDNLYSVVMEKCKQSLANYALPAVVTYSMLLLPRTPGCNADDR